MTITKAESAANWDVAYKLLSIALDVNKTEIVGSNIWNSETSMIELCNVVRLVTPPDGNNTKLVIYEDVRVVNIDFDLSVNYTTGELGLAAGAIGAAAGGTSVDDSVSACKCNPDSAKPYGYECNSDPLGPSEEIEVCVISSDPSIDIDELVSMVSGSGVAVHCC